MTEPKQVLGPDDVRRAVTRMAHEIIERNHGLDGVVAHRAAERRGLAGRGARRRDRAGIESRRAGRVARRRASTATTSACGPVLPDAVTDIPFDLDGAIVVLVDDVLFTGRTIRAALDALTDYGRPRAVQLAVMVDRGHRELPIRPDYVGKNLPTRARRGRSTSAATACDLG